MHVPTPAVPPCRILAVALVVATAGGCGVAPRSDLSCDRDGQVWFEPTSGAPTDLTDTFVGAVVVDEPGVLTLCPGSWETRVVVASDEVTVRGHGAGTSTLVGLADPIMSATDVTGFTLEGVSLVGHSGSSGADVLLELLGADATLREVEIVDAGSLAVRVEGTLTASALRLEGVLVAMGAVLSLDDTDLETGQDVGGIWAMDSTLLMSHSRVVGLPGPGLCGRGAISMFSMWDRSSASFRDVDFVDNAQDVHMSNDVTRLYTLGPGATAVCDPDCTIL